MGTHFAEEHRKRRCALVTAAHHFLTAPFLPGDTHSRTALETLLEDVRACSLSSIEVEVVLLRCLSALDRRTAGRRRNLVDTYLKDRVEPTGAIDRFRRCLEIGSAAIGQDRLVHDAIALIHARYRDPSLRQASIAMHVGLTPVALAVRFRAETGHTVGECLRAVRITKAATLLASSTKSIKEIWVDVGYNHASNFDHEFRKRFGISPSEFRARSSLKTTPSQQRRRESRGFVLLVDDDEGTRETVGRYLQLEGFSVECAERGRDAIERLDVLRPTMVLLAYHLPDLDGLACLRILRTQRMAAQVPVVLFTADMEIDVIDPEARALGARVASKLCDLEDVLQLVVSAASRS